MSPVDLDRLLDVGITAAMKAIPFGTPGHVKELIRGAIKPGLQAMLSLLKPQTLQLRMEPGSSATATVTGTSKKKKKKVTPATD